MRKVLLVLGGVAGLAFTALVSAAFYVRTAVPDYDGRVVLDGLAAEVEVWRDSLGVPHVWAGSLEDLAFAQGYVHAQDRLWQMELFRRVAEGRLAEVLGETLVDTDAFFRTLGLWEAAARNEAGLDRSARRTLEAYAGGVNAWISARTGALPPEFLALRFEPAPWTIRHSLAIEQIMAFDLAAYQTGLDLARAVRRLGPEKAAVLFPEYPEWGDVIVPPLPPPVPLVAASLLDGLSAVRASNAWVIGGARTASGRPILANDMHLALRAPSLWYLMALHGGGVDVAGMTLAGAPFVAAGHNRAIAWGYTNAMVDDADFFIERVDPADSARYLTPDGSAAFEVRLDTIRVRGRDEPVLLPIRSTRHGPILTPVERDAEGELLALRWAAHDPSGTHRALLALNLAANWGDFTRAMEQFDNPHQNVVYADTAGHIGYWMGGRVPVRGEGRRPPLLPVPGWTGDWDWTGELPFERHPHALDPAHGYVVTANNRQALGADADAIAAEWAPPFRAQRIREMIEQATSPLDAEAVHAQQLDVRDAFAARYIDRAVAAARSAGLDAGAELLRGWDLEARADSRAAALFYAWYQSLRELAARDLYDGERGWFPGWSLEALLESRVLPWREAGGDTAFAALAARAILRADSVAAGRSWGELHRVSAGHALGSVSVLERTLRLNLGPVPASGSPFTVNVSHYSGEFPVVAGYGASQRHVVDMADVDGAGGFILPTGQSGIPLAPHYRDQFERWLEGGLWRIPLGRPAAEARTVHRQTLVPAGRERE